MFKPLVVFVPSLTLMLACSNDGSGNDSIYGMPTAGTLTNASNSNSGGTEAGTEAEGDGDPSGDGDGSPEAKLDVLGGETGMMTAGDEGDGDGCKKVDFLFVIDNSGSMLEEQTSLAASFPSFINSIMSTLDQAQDYHIMVVDTDAWVYAGCEIFCLVPFPGLCVGYECGVTQPEECEDIVGAGVTHPKGANASNMDCNFSNGLRFMTDAEPSLVATFQCAARVGTDSTDDPERPMQAMVNAIAGSGAVATCNTDFLRDDAILVVTFITDEDDNPGDGSDGTVDTWRQALIDAKNGDESAIVMLGLFGGDGSVCGGNAEASPRLQQFLDSWGDKGLFGPICNGDYDTFFQDAVDTIDTTCDEFTPPG